MIIMSLNVMWQINRHYEGNANATTGVMSSDPQEETSASEKGNYWREAKICKLKSLKGTE